MQQPDSKQKKRLGMNRNVFVLGWVSFFTDVSSEMIFSALPLFLSSVLGVGTFLIGLIEGLGDSAAKGMDKRTSGALKLMAENVQP